MARLSYVDPSTITDPQIRGWLDDAVAAEHGHALAAQRGKVDRLARVLRRLPDPRGPHVPRMGGDRDHGDGDPRAESSPGEHPAPAPRHRAVHGLVRGLSPGSQRRGPRPSRTAVA